MEQPKPFELEYSPQFAELLDKLNISLALSTYQAGKVILISPYSGDKLIQLPRTYSNAMGMAFDGEKLAVAEKTRVVVHKKSRELAPLYPNKMNTYDSIFLPRASYYTGYLALHDMAFIKNKLIAVNTIFSCISEINENQSFTEIWHPPFISNLAPEDRCHLNGIAIENDEIKYVTALGKSDKESGWRENKMNGGILMNYPEGEIILEGLAMPHSPRIYNGKLYVLNSAQGELIEVNPETGTYEVVLNLGGFARGMDIFGDYLFIGVSKLRHNSKVFSDLPIAKTSFAGVIAVYLPYKTIAGSVKYKMSVDEIYDVKVLPGLKRPNILNPESELANTAVDSQSYKIWGEIVSEDEKGNGKNKATEQLKVNILQRIQPSDILEQFEPLLYGKFAKDLKQKRIHDLLNLLVITTSNNNPVGAVVFAAKDDFTAKIYSVFVAEEYRNNKIASNMLQQLSEILKQNNIKYTEAIYDNQTTNIEIVKKLFAKFPEINLVEE